MYWINHEEAGLLPQMLDASSSDGLAAQIAKEYIGGWYPQEGFSLKGIAAGTRLADVPMSDTKLLYPGDRPLGLKAAASKDLVDESAELLLLFEFDFVAIVQPDGSFEVSRCD